MLNIENLKRLTTDQLYAMVIDVTINIGCVSDVDGHSNNEMFELIILVIFVITIEINESETNEQ